jgi:type IV pilus assembly protein PilX
MISNITNAPRRERGVALIAALLILIVITILGMAMFRSYGLQQRIGGNTREKSRAFNAALASQDFAEWYLTSNNGANSTANTTCSGTNAASVTTVMVCSNPIPTTVAQPDTWGAAFTYTPTPPTGSPQFSTTAGAQGAYAQLPQFYISYLGAAGTGTSYVAPLGQNRTLFQVDAAGWAGTTQTVAVVESAYTVSSIGTTIPPSSSSTIQKNVSLGGP